MSDLTSVDCLFFLDFCQIFMFIGMLDNFALYPGQLEYYDEAFIPSRILWKILICYYCFYCSCCSCCCYSRHQSGKVQTPVVSFTDSMDVSLSELRASNPGPGKHHFTFCFYKFDFFKFHIWMISYSICLSLFDIFHLTLFCGVGEDSWEFLALQGDPTSPS